MRDTHGGRRTRSGRAAFALAVGGAFAVLLGACSGDGAPKVASGNGVVTVAFTKPVERSGDSTAKVVCARIGRNYNVVANNVTVEGLGITFTVQSNKYTGPGEYDVTTNLVLTKDAAAAMKAGTRLPATLNDSGGTIRIENQGGMSGTVSWTCP